MRTTSGIGVAAAVCLALMLSCSRTPPPSPEQRLRAEIQALESSISADEYAIRDEGIELEQKQANMKYDLAKAMNEARAYGIDVEAVRTQTVAELRQELTMHIELYKMWREILQDDRKTLERKKNELRQLSPP